MNQIIPGFDGMPPVKDHFEPEEKALLVAKAAEAGIHVVADAYGINWHTIVSWKKYYGKETVFKKTPAKKVSKKNFQTIIIQSPSGQEITPGEILEKIGSVDKIYVRVDENKAYWVKAQENGAIDLW